MVKPGPLIHPWYAIWRSSVFRRAIGLPAMPRRKREPSPSPAASLATQIFSQLPCRFWPPASLSCAQARGALLRRRSLFDNLHTFTIGERQAGTMRSATFGLLRSKTSSEKRKSPTAFWRSNERRRPENAERKFHASAVWGRLLLHVNRGPPDERTKQNSLIRGAAEIGGLTPPRDATKKGSERLIARSPGAAEARPIA
jgi:hypothetical protein